MTKEEKQMLYENTCNDINCGTFILLPQYVDKLIVKYTKVYRRKLRRIKKENAELKTKCYKKAVKDYCELEKKNAKLKLKLEALEGQTPWKDIKDKSELIKENAKLKSEKGCESCTKFDEVQATKAKEIIKEMLSILPKENIEGVYEIIEEAEQFLKESE